MTTTIDDSRSEILAEVRAKRESALRYARGGNAREEEYWLGVAGRMTAWIEHLEHDGARTMPSWAGLDRNGARPGIDLPPNARPQRATVPAEAAEQPRRSYSFNVRPAIQTSPIVAVMTSMTLPVVPSAPITPSASAMTAPRTVSNKPIT